jgi:hypothetical protein
MMETTSKPPMMDRVTVIARIVVSGFGRGDGDGEEAKDEAEVSGDMQLQ